MQRRSKKGEKIEKKPNKVSASCSTSQPLAFRFGKFLFCCLFSQGTVVSWDWAMWVGERVQNKNDINSILQDPMIKVATIFHRNPWQSKTHFLHPMQLLHLLVVPSTARDTGSAASSPGVGVYATSPDPNRMERWDLLFSRLRNGPSNTDLVSKNTLNSTSHGYSQIVNSSLIHV